MTKTLNMSRLSQELTPKERVKLITQLALKGLDKIKFEEKDLPNQADISQIVNACPNDQINEYNRYLRLKEYIWRRAMPLIEMLMQQLTIYRNGLSPLMLSLSFTPFVHRAYEWINILSVSRNKISKQKDELNNLPYSQIKMVLKHLLTVKVDKMTNHGKTRCIYFADPVYEKLIRLYSKRFNETIQETYNYIGLVNAIEDKYFDGMSLTSPNADNPLGTIPRAKKDIKEFVKKHNQDLKEITVSFKQVNVDLWEFKFPFIEKYYLDPPTAPDQKWINKRLAEIEESY